MRKIIAVIALFSIVFLAACQQTTPPPDKVVYRYGAGTYDELKFDYGAEVKTLTFDTEDQLLSFIKDNSGANLGYGSSVKMQGASIERLSEPMPAMDMAESAPAAGADYDGLDYSGTNVQVQGVDEADIIKTDGNYIYTVTGQTLFIIRAYPGEDAEIISTIRFDQQIESLFVDGDYLAVFGNYYDNDYYKKIDIVPRQGMTFFDVYDISDRSDPEPIRKYKFEGNYFRGRMSDGFVYMLTTSQPEYRLEMPTPLIIEDDVVRSVPIGHVHYFNIPYNYPMFVNIHALELGSGDMDSVSVAVEGSQELYMSGNNIYVTYGEYVNEYDIQKGIVMELLEPHLAEKHRDLISKIKQTDNAVLSRLEKEAKIYQVYESVIVTLDEDEQETFEERAEGLLEQRLEEIKYFEYTVINRIEVDGLDIDPEANGKVPGRVLNQFSMDEYDGVFRIATTLSPRWSRFEGERSLSSNNVYALDMDLGIIGELEGLAEDESIFSTRFMGDRLYMVTFKQIDPFFVIDLSDPTDITELGKLKIPGFSRYLHPYDEDTIIGIGKDTDDGRQAGLKVSLFDVSDVENPEEIAKYVTESDYADSTALWEHKAFLFSKEKELMVIPAYSMDYRDGQQSYNGAFVFHITKDEIELRGLVDHSEGFAGDQPGWGYYQPAVERSLYIEELLYTKSPGLLRINEIEDLSSVKEIQLSYGDIKIY
ncbi:beta-propeller domain-containing protein [Candidatus Woesearchaeota archaeon]|nr:beta-propeller domain-containing protein [Candidatus Woesearchaeota archaeon]